MKVTRMIIIFLFCVLTMGVSQCEGMDIEVCLDPPSTDPAEEPENPYLVKGSPNTCVDFPFRACKGECLLDTDTGADTCREYCCSKGTREATDTCHAIVPFTTEAVEACIRDIEFASCGWGCLESCRVCTDTCAEYYEYCTDGVVDRTALGWGWRD